MVRSIIIALGILAALVTVADAKRHLPEAQHCRTVIVPKIQAMAIQCVKRAKYETGDVEVSSARRAHQKRRSFRGPPIRHGRAYVGRRYHAGKMAVAKAHSEAAAFDRSESVARRMAGSVNRSSRIMARSSSSETAAGGSGLVSVAGKYLGGNPTGWARAWCGAFMRLVIRQAGLPDNPSGNLARSWAHYGRPSGPSPGAIAVMPHHVGIVLVSEGGRVLLRSGNHGRRVGDGWYSASRIIAYRSAS